MPIQPPKIDQRDRSGLLRDLEALMPFYVVSADRLYGCERVILQRTRRDPFVGRSALLGALACDDNAASARPSV
jgi:hypothetical protein